MVFIHTEVLMHLEGLQLPNRIGGIGLRGSFNDPEINRGYLGPEGEWQCEDTHSIIQTRQYSV